MQGNNVMIHGIELGYDVQCFCNLGPKICAVAIMICRAQSEPGFIFNIAADLSELYWEGLYALLQAALGGDNINKRCAQLSVEQLSMQNHF